MVIDWLVEVPLRGWYGEIDWLVEVLLRSWYDDWVAGGVAASWYFTDGSAILNCGAWLIIDWLVVLLLLVGAWLIGLLVVLAIEFELVKCGSSSLWHVRIRGSKDICSKGRHHVLHNRWTLISSTSSVPECIASELFSSLTFPPRINELKLKLCKTVWCGI